MLEQRDSEHRVSSPGRTGAQEKLSRERTKSKKTSSLNVSDGIII